MPENTAPKKDVPSFAVITPVNRLTLPTLITPRRYKDPATGREGPPKFGAQLIFEAADLEKFKLPTADGKFEDVNVKQKCVELAKKMWPGSEMTALFPKSLKNGQLKGWPLRKGDLIIENMKKGGKGGEKLFKALEGRTVIAAQTGENLPPRLKHKVDGKRVELDRADPKDLAVIKKLFRGGNYVYGELTFKPFEVNENFFITAYLNALCFVKEGESFGSGSLMDRFDGIDGGDSDIDPTIDEDFGDI